MNPQIKYGRTTGGIPRISPEDGNMNSHGKTWCLELDGTYRSHTLGPRSGFAVYPCTTYDERVWHWCDKKDGLCHCRDGFYGNK